MRHSQRETKCAVCEEKGPWSMMVRAEGLGFCHEECVRCQPTRTTKLGGPTGLKPAAAPVRHHIAVSPVLTPAEHMAAAYEIARLLHQLMQEYKQTQLGI